MPLSEKEREVTLTVLHRFLNAYEPSPHKLLVRQCKDPKIIERLMQLGILGSFTAEPVAYLPRAIAFHYSGDADALRRAKDAATITIKVLKNLFEVELDKEDFTPDDVAAHAAKICDTPPFISELKLGLFLVAEFPNVLKSCRFNSTRTEMVGLQFNDNILALSDIDGIWDRHVEYQSRFVEGKPDPLETNDDDTETAESPSLPLPHSGLLVFISHSSKDADLATALIDLLRASLGLRADQIRCSSVDGYRLPVGVNTEAQLRDEVNAAKVVIGLITPSSLQSYYVMFELGARWGANRYLAPLLAGVKTKELSGPLGLINALSVSVEAQLHQLVENISNRLDLPLEGAASYIRHIAIVRNLAEVRPTTNVLQTIEVTQDSAVNVEFTPWRGQFDKMYLTITNHGPKQSFRAQCRVLTRRNDPNPQPMMTFDLKWQYGGRDLFLARGQDGNLLIASAGEDKAANMESMKFEALTGQHAPDSRWTRGDKLLPEYVVEITILGDKSDHSQSMRFIVRAGKSCALEMYRPSDTN